MGSSRAPTPARCPEESHSLTKSGVPGAMSIAAVRREGGAAGNDELDHHAGGAGLHGWQRFHHCVAGQGPELITVRARTVVAGCDKSSENLKDSRFVVLIMRSTMTQSRRPDHRTCDGAMVTPVTPPAGGVDLLRAAR